MARKKKEEIQEKTESKVGAKELGVFRNGEFIRSYSGENFVKNAESYAEKIRAKQGGEVEVKKIQ